MPQPSSFATRSSASGLDPVSSSCPRLPSSHRFAGDTQHRDTPPQRRSQRRSNHLQSLGKTAWRAQSRRRERQAGTRSCASALGNPSRRRAIRRSEEGGATSAVLIKSARSESRPPEIDSRVRMVQLAASIACRSSQARELPRRVTPRVLCTQWRPPMRRQTRDPARVRASRPGPPTSSSSTQRQEAQPAVRSGLRASEGAGARGGAARRGGRRLAGGRAACPARACRAGGRRAERR